MKPKTLPNNKPRGWIYGAKWGGYPCQARAVKIVVGAAPPTWWCADLVGKPRRAVEIVLPGERPRYVDNETGWALAAFLRGLAPLPGFKFLPAFKVLDDETIPLFYKVDP